MGDIFIRMRRGEEVSTPFPDVNPLFKHMIKQQIHIALEDEVKEGAKMGHLNGHLLLCEVSIECLGQPRCALIQLLLKGGAVCLHMFETG